MYNFERIDICMKVNLEILTHGTLQETLHTRCRIAHGRLNPNEPEYSPNELDDGGRKPSLLRNRPLMAIIIVYCVFSLQEIAYSEVRQLQFTSL